MLENNTAAAANKRSTEVNSRIYLSSDCVAVATVELYRFAHDETLLNWDHTGRPSHFLDLLYQTTSRSTCSTAQALICSMATTHMPAGQPGCSRGPSGAAGGGSWVRSVFLCEGGSCLKNECRGLARHGSSSESRYRYSRPRLHTTREGRLS